MRLAGRAGPPDPLAGDTDRVYPGWGRRSTAPDGDGPGQRRSPLAPRVCRRHAGRRGIRRRPGRRGPRRWRARRRPALTLHGAPLTELGSSGRRSQTGAQVQLLDRMRDGGHLMRPHRRRRNRHHATHGGPAPCVLHHPGHGGFGDVTPTTPSPGSRPSSASSTSPRTAARPRPGSWRRDRGLCGGIFVHGTKAWQAHRVVGHDSHAVGAGRCLNAPQFDARGPSLHAPEGPSLAC